jgi:flagellin-like protein
MRRAVSPVVATVILVAVAITVAVGIAYWSGLIYVLDAKQPPEYLEFEAGVFTPCLEDKFGYGYIYNGEGRRGHYYLTFAKGDSSECYELENGDSHDFVRIRVYNVYHEYVIEFINDDILILKWRDG